MRKLLLVFVLFGFHPLLAQRGRIDSLRAVIFNVPEDTSRVDAYNQLASLYRRLNFDSMYYFGSKARELSLKLKYRSGEAQGNLMMGVGELRRGNLLDAMDLCQKALELSGGSPEVQAEALNYIGLNYNYQGSYPTALDYYQRALSLLQSVKNKAIVASILGNVGGIYYNLKDYNRALDYWKQTLELQQQLADHDATAATMSNVGLAYTDKGDYRQALQYYFRSLNTHEADRVCPRLYPLENIGTTYFKMGKLDSASYYLKKALTGAEECRNPVVEIGILSGLADVSKAYRQFPAALQYLTRAFEIGKRAGLKRETSIVALSLAELYEQQGNTKQAFSIFKTYHALRDSIYNSDNAKAIGRLEAKYEYDSAKKEQETARKFENLERERIATRQKWVRDTFIGGFLVMLFVAGIIYRGFQRKKISNMRLEQLNREIQAHEAALVEQAEQLKHLNESLSELNSGLEKKVAERTRQLIEKNTELENKNAKLADYAFINAHKLRAPVATILGLVKLFEVDPEDRDEIVRKIGESTVALNDIVKEIRVTLEKEKSKGT